MIPIWKSIIVSVSDIIIEIKPCKVDSTLWGIDSTLLEAVRCTSQAVVEILLIGSLSITKMSNISHQQQLDYIQDFWRTATYLDKQDVCKFDGLAVVLFWADLRPQNNI